MTFLGEAGTGKSCLLHHFTHNFCPFSLALIFNHSSDRMVVKDHSQHTIGVEFSSQTVKLGEKRIKLQVRYCLAFRRSINVSFLSVMGYSRARTFPVSLYSPGYHVSRHMPLSFSGLSQGVITAGRQVQFWSTISPSS
jgi:GTPase SAR1 family protein